MGIVAIGSIGHSPGVTTTAVAMTLRWPRPAVLLEADTSTTSAVLAGRLRGQVPHRMGLTGLASAALHGELEPPLVWAHSIELAPDRRLIPGFSSIGAARGTDSIWSPLAEVLRSLEGTGADVLIDLGRFDASDARAPLLSASQFVLVCSGATLPDIASTTAKIDGHSNRLAEVSTALERVGSVDSLGVALIDRAHENYESSEFHRVAGLPVLGTIPYAPSMASHYSHGATLPRRSFTLGNPYHRAIDTLVAAIDSSRAARERRVRLPAAPSGDVS